MKVLSGVVACLLLSALGAAAAGCSGDQEPDLDRYYQRLDAIFQDVADGLAALEAQVSESSSRAGTAARFFKGETELWRIAVIDRLGAIVPPAKVSQAHEELVRTGVAFQERLDYTLDHYSSVVESTAKAEAVAKVLQPGLDASRERFEDACRTLQGIAEAEGLDVELGRQVAGFDCSL